jgi:hypothetical protein
MMILSDTTPTARKEHRCSLCCSMSIQPGQKYRLTKNVYDDQIYTFKECLPCVEVGATLWAENIYDDEGYTTEGAVDWARESINDEKHGAMARAFLSRAGIPVKEDE